MVVAQIQIVDNMKGVCSTPDLRVKRAAFSIREQPITPTKMTSRKDSQEVQRCLKFLKLTWSRKLRKLEILPGLTTIKRMMRLVSWVYNIWSSQGWTSNLWFTMVLIPKVSSRWSKTVTASSRATQSSLTLAVMHLQDWCRPLTIPPKATSSSLKPILRHPTLLRLVISLAMLWTENKYQLSTIIKLIHLSWDLTGHSRFTITRKLKESSM